MKTTIYRLLFTLLLGTVIYSASGQQSYEMYENFHIPRFYPEKFFMYNTDTTTQFMRSNNSGFEWGAYSPVVTTDWGPIGYLYSDVLDHIRNALCFTTAAEYPGSYAYCQFDSPDHPGENDSLVGISSVSIKFQDDGPGDKIGLMIRDANGEWFYSKAEHGIFADGSEIIFNGVDQYAWMKVKDSISDNLNDHAHIDHGLGDIREDALEGTPDMSYIIGAGMMLHEAAISDFSLRIEDIRWTGKLPETVVDPVQPTLNATLSILSTTLKWIYKEADIVRFDIWLGTEGGSLELVGDSILTTEVYIDKLSDNSSYRWQVDVIHPDGEVEKGIEWTFQTKKGMSPFFEDLQTKKISSTPAVRWTNLGPGMSGYCDEYFLHPTDPNYMYMNLDMGNAYSSNDNGLSWLSLKDWDTDGEIFRPVWMDFSRQDPDFGYGLDDKGYLLETTDRGRTWKRGFNFSSKHSVIVADPNNDNNWYVGAGQLWRVKDVHRSLDNIHGTQYRNTSYGHIWVSKDKGATWTKVSDNFDANLDVAKIFVDPEESNTVYAYTNYGFYKSTDGGYNWDLKGQGLPYNQPRDGDIYYDPATGMFNLYLLEQTHYEDNGNGSVKWSGGIFISSDRGENWTDITGNLPVDLTKINSSDVNSKYFRALGYWFGIESSTAQSRFNKKPTSALSVFNRIIVSPHDPNMIFLSHNWKHDFSFGPGDIWRTKDGGKSWVVVGRNGPYWRTETDKSYWMSRDNPLGINMKYAHMEHDMQYEGVAAGTRILLGKVDGDLICVHEQQVLRSKDYGDSWYQIDDDETAPGSGYWVGRGGSNLPGESLLLETGMKRYLFLSGEHGLWISAPDGENVKPDGVAVEQLTGQSKMRYDATSIASAAVHPNDTNTMYILMFRQSFRGHIRRTQDGGKTWTDLGYPVQYGGNLSSDHIYQYDLNIDKDDPDRMYFCVPTEKWVPFTSTLRIANGLPDYNDYGVFRSLDGGVNWALANNGLPANANVYRLEMDPENPRILYVSLNTATNGDPGGLYISEDGGDTWTQMDIPSIISQVNHLFVDRTNGNLYLSAGKVKGATDEGGVWKSSDKGVTWDKIFYMPNVYECYTSNVNPDLILVNVNRANAVNSLNPGVFFSVDGGQTWTKANYQLGQPSRIRALRPDPFDENVFWCGLMGSGWYKGIRLNSDVRAMASNKYVYEAEVVSLDATASLGDNLDYRWTVPPGISLSSSSTPAPSFTAPDVENDTTYKLMLHVSNSVDEDSLQVLVTVRNNVTYDADKVESLIISPEDMELILGDTREFIGQVTPADLDATIFWRSLDPSIASVTPWGEVSGLKIGSTKIIASLGNTSDTASIHVIENLITSITLSVNHIDMNVGDVDTLQAYYEPANPADTSIVWTSGNEAILEVDQAGIIHAIDTGYTYVVATNDAAGISDTCTVSISDPSIAADHWANRITIFPNPATEYVILRGLEEMEVKITLFSTEGKVLMQTRKHRIPLEMLVPGEYFVRIMSSAGSIVKQIIKI